MSWLKKLFGNKERDIEEEVYTGEEERRTEQREMRTRMTYEYPKSPFRFPLIEDPVRPEKRRYAAPQERIERVPARPSAVKRAPEQKKVHKEPKAATKKIEPKNRRPFEPTEIPSPIFGFRKPAAKEEQADFEYELQDAFLTDALAEEELANENQLKELTGPAAEGEMAESPAAFAETGGEREDLPVKEEECGDAPVPEEILWPETGAPAELEISHEEPAEIDGAPEAPAATETLEGEEHDLEKTPVQIAENEPERLRSRGRMPFNVLMLKEDRKKLEYRKLAQERERKQEKPALHIISGKEAAPMEESRSEHAASAETASAIPENRREEEPVRIPETVPLSQSEPQKERSAAAVAKTYESYETPATGLLSPPVGAAVDEEWLQEQRELLDETLRNFNVHAHVANVSQGPSVTRFEIQPEPGVKVSKITNLSDDIKLSMAAKDIRIEAPIPGKRSVGIEIPNQSSRPVQLSEIIDSGLFEESESPLTAALGLDISGSPVVTDIRKMPHGLIAGATGSGKSVCINSILVSLLYKASPEEVKLMLIDPKMVELAPYNHIPHLVSPVITDVKAATAALKWAVEEMERRYELFAHASVRDISRFNQLAEKSGQHSDRLPYLVIVIDELADLMMMAPADVEESICRIAQKARACGIHLLIATQRPSVDVITGLIKANVPTRIAFSVSSQVDSRTIIDISGAERLLGRGDMLFLDSGSSKPVRLQGTYVSDEEIDRVIEHVRSQGAPDYLFEQDELLKKAQIQEDEDELFIEACEFVIAQGSASTSLLQRQYRIGYNRAARLMAMMEERGIISGAKGGKARDILAGEGDLELLKETLVN